MSKLSKEVLERIKEEVLIKNLCIEKNIVNKEWASKNLYWETRGKSNTGEYYQVWHHGSRDYWGEWDDYPFTESLQYALAPDVPDEEFNDEDPPFLEREDLIDLLRKMDKRKNPMFGESK